jgi:hypothetical protein
VAAALRDRRRYGPNHEPVIYLEHEPGSSGVDAYKHTARTLAGFPVYPDRPTGAKAVRAEPWASQCAAGNVYLVDDGTWDVDGWIAEHCLFPLGSLKDRVDSASGAFARLVAGRRGPLMQVYPLREHAPRPGLRIVVGTRELLAQTAVEPPHLWITIEDPPSATTPEAPSRVGAPTPDALTLAFADLDPEDCQSTWGLPVAPFGRPAEELILTPAIGKKLWSFLLRRRDPPPRGIVLQDDGDRRALSLAYAIADTLRYPRSQSIVRAGREESPEPDADAPPNQHVYDLTKRARALVV